MNAINRLLVIWLTAVAVGPATIYAQKRADYATERYGLFVTDNRQNLRIAFEVLSDLVIVPVQVNDSDAHNFILGTGVSTSIITDPAALIPKSLRLTRKVTITGAGE